MTDTTREGNDGAQNGSEGFNEVWSVWRECRRGVACVGPDRYPEAVEHRLQHNRKRDDWWFVCGSCGGRNTLTLRESERDLLQALSRWRTTVEILRESGVMVL